MQRHLGGRPSSSRDSRAPSSALCIGFVVGGGLAAFGLQADAGQVLALGYLLALFGFLLGIGAFRFWLTWAAGREIDVADEHAAHGRAGDWQRYFRFTTDHKVIGIQYLVTAFALFLTAGTVAMLMRFELAQPGIATSKDFYNTIMSTHGAMMITVALVSIIGGLGNFLVPLMVGARDMAFPKANALSYWMLPLRAPARGDQPAPRRLRHRLDCVSAAQPAGQPRSAGVPHGVRDGRRLLDPERHQLPRHGLPDARAGHVADAHADLRLGA